MSDHVRPPLPPFVRVPEYVVERLRDLDGSALAVLLVICKRCDRTTWECEDHPHVTAHLAGGLSSRSVARAVETLEAAGIVTAHRPGRGIRNAKVGYELHLSPRSKETTNLSDLSQKNGQICHEEVTSLSDLSRKNGQICPTPRTPHKEESEKDRISPRSAGDGRAGRAEKPADKLRQLVTGIVANLEGKA